MPDNMTERELERQALLDRRRNNLARWCLEVFKNNRAQMARTAFIHPNQMTFMLADNPAIRRPISDDYAKKLEANLNMPAGYLDQIEGAGTDGGYQIHSGAVLKLASVLRESTSLVCLSVRQAWLTSHKVGDPKEVWLGEVAGDGMAPELPEGTQVVVEWVGGKKDKDGRGAAAEPAEAATGFAGDGIYVLNTAAGVMLRRVQRRMDGSFLVSSPNPAYVPEALPTLDGVGFFARVISAVRFQ